MKEYIVSLTVKELEIIGAGLQNVAYQHAAPLIKKLEEQINKQMQAEIPAESTGE